MAGFMGKLRTFIGMEDTWEDEGPGESRDGYGGEEAPSAEASGYGQRSRQYGLSPERQSEDNDYYWENARLGQRPRSGGGRERENVVFMQNKALERITAEFKIVVIEPNSVEECTKLVDSLKARKPIIINLEKLEYATARNIYDFLCGATYALSGSVQKVANNIYVFAPENVDVSTSTDSERMSFGGDGNNPWKA